MYDSRSNVLNGPILWWYIPHIWHWGDLLCRTRSRRSHRPHGLHFPAHDQVHLPQIWHVGRNRKTRRHVHPSAEHCKRENLHLPLVLDASFICFDLFGSALQIFHHLLTADASLLALHSLSPSQERVHQHHN